MEDPDVIERIVRAALKQGGERLELVAGQAAVMTRSGERLKAGQELDPGALDAWWGAISSPENDAKLDLGLEVTVRLERGGDALLVAARRNDGVLKVSVTRGGETPGEAAAVSPVDGPVKAESAVAVSAEHPLDRLLIQMVELDASDLHLSSGVAPMLRLHGDIRPLGGFGALTSDHIQLMCDDIAPAKNRREFRELNDTDFAYEIEGLARFRVNMFRDRKGAGAVLRQIPAEIQSLEKLGLPESVKNLCQLTKGLVLVTGPTGSGKSTTLAAMVDFINETRTEHIITIEDPVEFVHTNKRCLVNQREVYSHTQGFKHALRAALREDPDIVLVGEMRDLETIAIAIETAETGHLVLGTLHTTTAISTVDRIIDQFPADRQDQIRIMLSDCLKGVVAQSLCRRAEGGRVAAFEILLGVPAVSNLIREGKTHQLASIMQTGKRQGMILLNDSLADLVRRGEIDTGEAMLRSIDKDGLRGLLKSGSQGQSQD